MDYTQLPSLSIQRFMSPFLNVNNAIIIYTFSGHGDECPFALTAVLTVFAQINQTLTIQ